MQSEKSQRKSKRMNERHKLGYLLTALVALPIFALGLIGLHALNNDLENYQFQEIREANSELIAFDDIINNYLDNFKNEFKEVIERLHGQDPLTLRCIFHQSCPQKIKNQFTLIVTFNKTGERIYPPAKTTSQLFMEIRRLVTISSSLITAKTSLDQLVPTARLNGVWSNFVTPEGHNLLFCWLDKKEVTYCGALDREKLINKIKSYLTNNFNKQNSNQIRLIDSVGKTLWKNTSLQSTQILAKKHLSAPLYFWHIEKLQNKSSTPPKYPLTLAALTLPIGLLLVFLAYTLFRDQKKVLAEANDRANFAASISHELRTPLTNLQLYADLIRNKTNSSNIKQGQLSDHETKEVAKYTKIIASETTRLSEMVDNALTITRGNHPTNRQKIKAIPDHIIEETVTRLSPLLGKQVDKILFSLQTSKEVEIDRNALEQILVNLLDNARKYAPDANIRIKSKIEDDLLTLTVRDWGPSFSKGASRSLFKPFSQSIKKEAKQDGFGLGLAVVEQLARENNGTVKAEQANPGARFIVTLKINQLS